MAKSTKQKSPNPPQFNYPQTPYVVGLDWIELPVQQPKQTADLYRQIGFAPRGTVGRATRLAAGGANILLRKKTGTPKNTNTAKTHPPSGLVIQFTIDNVQLKRKQLTDLGLKPSSIRRQARGDSYFQWQDPDGHTVRFVGPTRRPTDKHVD